MLRKLVQGLTLGATLVAVPAATAAADESATNVCTSGALVVCSSFSLTNTSGNHWELTLTINSVYGGSPGSAFLSAVGLFSGTAPTGTFSNETGPAGWTFNAGATGTCSDLSNAINGIYLCDATNGSSTLQTLTFGFDYTGNDALTTINTSGVIYHLQGIAQVGATCSGKIAVTAGGAETEGTATTQSTDCVAPTTTVPEPASLFLVGTGLLGLGGLVRRRRRNG